MYGKTFYTAEENKKRYVARREIYTAGNRFTLNYTSDYKIKEYFQRLRKKQRKGKMPTMLMHGWQPQKNPIKQQYKHKLRVKELERKVDLLRSFLHSAGSMLKHR